MKTFKKIFNFIKNQKNVLFKVRKVGCQFSI
jgi:hypothetical protein